MDTKLSDEWRLLRPAVALSMLLVLSFLCLGAFFDVSQNSKASTLPSKSVVNSTGRKLLVISPEARKEALNGLEDVLLEPPRASSGRLNEHLKRTRYLPDLTGDTLDGYNRLVFVDVGPSRNAKVDRWFERHYPTRNRQFEIIHVETEEEEEVEEEMSGWLERNVGEEDYVVMKAEAGVVEGLMRSKAIELVDEMFLECRHQWQKSGGGGGGAGRRKVQRSRRAYWECLALYGKLRDGGVAVHQWWD